MKYPRYAEYKNSGAEWLGDIPLEWSVWKFVHGFEVIGSGTTPPTGEESFYEGTIPWITTSELREDIISESKTSITQKALDSLSALRLYPEGSLVIALYGATIGRLGMLGVPSTVNQACCVMYGGQTFHQKFVFYFLQAFRERLMVLATGGGQPNISQETIRSLRCAVPNRQEQGKIVDYLDLQMMQIDSLIAEQEKLVSLLREKRQAVVSHAVTKGLHPDAPMKDSGVEWLRMVPKHWSAVPLKRCLKCPLQYGANEPAEMLDPDSPRYIRITDLQNDGTLNPDTFRSLPLDIATPYLLDEGDILLARSGATVGKSFIYKRSMGKAAYAGYLIKASTNDILLPEFLYQFLQSYGYWQWINSIFIKSTIQNVSAEKYDLLTLAIPPISEQMEIVEFLGQFTHKIDLLIEKASTSIALLTERRAALISAAVTGKIDVRDLVPTEAG